MCKSQCFHISRTPAVLWQITVLTEGECLWLETGSSISYDLKFHER